MTIDKRIRSAAADTLGGQSVGSQRRHKPDYVVFAIFLVLLLLAAVIIYSISPALASLRQEGRTANWYVLRQALFSAAAVGCFVIAGRVPLDLLRRFATPLLALSGIALLAVFIPGFGEEFNGARRWITVAGFSLQPVELLKLGLLVYFARFFAVRIQNKTVKDASYTVLPIILIMGLASLVVTVFQKDLGSTVAMASIVFGMMYFSPMPRRHIAMLLAPAMAAGWFAIVMFPHRVERLSVFLNYGADQQDLGWHLSQAYVAIGSGGFWGKGLGQSVQVHGYLPEAANDSIFAIMAEKFGFLGSCAVVIVFAVLLMRILRMMDRISDSFIRLLCGAVFAWLFAHIAMNVGAMTGLVPITGITLPVVSYGGSSLLAISVALGLVYNASRYTRRIEVRSEGEK